MTDLGTLGGHAVGDMPDSFGADINNKGQVTGASVTASGFMHAFRWDPATGMQDLGTPGENSIGRGINENGQVTGSRGDGGAFLWDPATGLQDLGTLGGSQASGHRINAKGQVTGTSQIAPGSFQTHAFLWDAVGGMQDLGTLGGTNSIGLGINSRGQVTGMDDSEGVPPRTFLWDPVIGMRDLGNLGGSNISSFGNDINDSGQVTGASTIDVGLRAFLWDPATGMQDLNRMIPPGSGWILGQGLAINDTGQITGSGSFGGVERGFLLTPVAVTEVPEPGTLTLIGIGVVGFGLLRRRASSGRETWLLLGISLPICRLPGDGLLAAVIVRQRRGTRGTRGAAMSDNAFTESTALAPRANAAEKWIALRAATWIIAGSPSSWSRHRARRDRRQS
ncbi:HAF repeat-containing PEP-CTERM protein [Skermanella aerolata]|uniref:HAF repeat-containing PEP-CTERM protein n=1 Tax=Skermanella aerolata TaxID=393310 RepID=UPI0014704F34|nr:HAF repeat-containing PEP-CTERM protein [Skermanella aerolata]